MTEDDFDENAEIDPAEMEEAVKELRTIVEEKPDESTDLLQIFLRDVGSFDLLTAAQEIELAKQIKSDDPIISKKASDALVNHNLRLVISIARGYHRGRGNVGIGYVDLIQEGVLGLIRAVELYDHTKTGKDGKSYKFSTYSTWWIRQAVRRGLAEKSRNIRIPMHIIDKLGKISAAERELQLAFGREPTSQEIAAHLNMKPSTVAEILRGAQEPISLSQPMSDSREESGEVELGASLQDATTPGPHDTVMRNIEKEVLDETLSKLSPRSLNILEHRHGLNGKPVLNLTDIGKIWGITYQRVRQIEIDILAKLRADANLQILRDEF